MTNTAARTQLNEALFFSFLLIAIYGIAKHLAVFSTYGYEIGFLATLIFQLYVPIWAIRKEGTDPADYGLNAHGLSHGLQRLDKQGFISDLKRTVTLSAVTIIPWIILFHIWQQMRAAQHGQHATFSFSLPPEFMYSVLTNTFLIALPEETFYRGFLQTRFLRVWPNELNFLGIPVGRAVLFTSALFAFAHYIGEYNLLRLGPFFPALLFSMLTLRSGSIMGAVIYHAMCNMVSEVLQASYRWY